MQFMRPLLPFVLSQLLATQSAYADSAASCLDRSRKCAGEDHGIQTLSQVFLQQSQSSFFAHHTAEADSGRFPLRGYYLTLRENTQEQQRIQALLDAEDIGGSVLPFFSVDDPADLHRTRVHKAHMAAVMACYEANPSEPCLILEDDAVWPQGNLSAMVDTIESEQGPDWDLIMLGMGNGRRWSDETLMQMLRPTSLMANSMRISGTLCGCHAYIINGGSSLLKIYGMLSQRDYARDRPEACVEGLTADFLNELGVHIVSTRYAFARQSTPAGGNSVYDWKM